MLKLRLGRHLRFSCGQQDGEHEITKAALICAQNVAKMDDWTGDVKGRKESVVRERGLT
jgi:hypothetical protein